MKEFSHDSPNLIAYDKIRFIIQKINMNFIINFDFTINLNV